MGQPRLAELCLVKNLQQAYFHQDNAYHELGKLYINTAQYYKAKLCYSKLLKSNPTDPSVYYNLGIVASNLQNNEESLIFYDKAISLKSNYYEAYNNRGILKVMNKKYDEGFKDLYTAVALQPSYPVTSYNLGLTHLYLKDSDSALYYFDQTISLDSNYLDAWYMKAVVYASILQKFDKAIYFFSKTIERNPQLANVYNDIGSAYFFSNDRENACKYWKKALEMGFQNAQLLINENCEN
jgi:tetratricopeptide (TPR) repeat protein